MKTNYFIALILSGFFLLSGCIHRPLIIVLSPDVHVAYSNIGSGQKIILEVSDKRPKKILGYLSSSDIIVTNQDINKILHDQISTGLKEHNFIPIKATEKASISMKIEIRDMEYGEYVFNFVSNVAFTTVVLDVICSNNSRNFEREYQVVNEEKIYFRYTREDTIQLINKSLSQAIEKILNDKELLNFLSST